MIYIPRLSNINIILVDNGASTNGFASYGGSANALGDVAPIRKPSRLEALPSMGAATGLGKSNIKSKKSVPVLNTMGTF